MSKYNTSSLFQPFSLLKVATIPRPLHVLTIPLMELLYIPSISYAGQQQTQKEEANVAEDIVE